jgi:hypothetical protein
VQTRYQRRTSAVEVLRSVPRNSEVIAVKSLTSLGRPQGVYAANSFNAVVPSIGYQRNQPPVKFLHFRENMFHCHVPNVIGCTSSAMYL